MKKELILLRKEMKKRHVDIYILPMSDFHASEYIGEYFKEIKYFTGFTGSSGTVVVTQKEAGLWTDGRYFVQAKNQLKDSGVKLYRMGEPNVETVSEYIKRILKKGMILGMDARLCSAAKMEEYKNMAKEVKASVKDISLADAIWKTRPAFPCGEIYVYPTRYAGESCAKKVKRVRDKMKEKEVSHLILSDLCDIAWLLNLRGDDIRHVPVFLSYVWLTEEECRLYVNKKSLTKQTMAYLSKNHIKVYDYFRLDKAIKTYFKQKKKEKVWLDINVINAHIYQCFPKSCQFVTEKNPTQLMKAVKNKKEIENTKKAHIKDGVAMTKFMYYIKNTIGKQTITELDVADYLYQLRKEKEGFLDLSFDSICAYGKNAAMMHYTATEESFCELEPSGFLLVDSGAHYLEGTTDITRTYVLGDISDKMRLYYTSVLRSHLRLMAAHFLKGCCGQNLDILARGPMWDLGLDYRCGTGHGIGHVLNVHEGPNAFRYRFSADEMPTPLEAGMITTNEPGVYEEEEFGIRIENEMLVVEDKKTPYGQFYKFETITYAPIDLDAVDISLLEQSEKDTLNAYHKLVFETIAPHLSVEEKQWLKEVTREI